MECQSGVRLSHSFSSTTTAMSALLLLLLSGLVALQGCCVVTLSIQHAADLGMCKGEVQLPAGVARVGLG